jgi:hypothetical protein
MPMMVAVMAGMPTVMIAVPVMAVVVAVGKSQRRSEQHERQQRGGNGFLCPRKIASPPSDTFTDESAVNRLFSGREQPRQRGPAGAKFSVIPSSRLAGGTRRPSTSTASGGFLRGRGEDWRMRSRPERTAGRISNGPTDVR